MYSKAQTTDQEYRVNSDRGASLSANVLVVVTFVDIVDSNLTAVFPVERATLRTAANVADVLVIVPQVITTDTAAGITLDKDAAAPRLIAPAVARLVNAGFVTRGVKLAMALRIGDTLRFLHDNRAMTDGKQGEGGMERLTQK